MSQILLGSYHKIIIEMSRKTISIDKNVESILREIQGRFIRSSSKSYSLSRIVNIALVSGILHSKDLSINEWNEIRSYARGRQVDLTDIDAEKFVENILLEKMGIVE